MSVVSKLSGALGNGARLFRYRVDIATPVLANIQDGDGVLTTLVKSAILPGVKITPRNFMYKGHTLPIDGFKQYDTEFSCAFYVDETYNVRLILERWVAFIDAFHLTEMPPQPTATFSGQVKSALSAMGGRIMDKITNSITTLPGDVTKASSGDTGITKIVHQVMGDVESDTNWVVVEGTKVYNEIQGTHKFEDDKGSSLYGTIKVTGLDYNGTSDNIIYTLHNVIPTSLGQIQFDDSNTTSIAEFTATFSFSHYTIQRVGSIGEVAGEFLSKKIGSFF